MAARPYYGAAGYVRAEEPAKEEGEGKRRKAGTRRTVDYGCPYAIWLRDRLCERSCSDEKPMRPALNELINVLSVLYSAKSTDASNCGIPHQSFDVHDDQIRSHIN